MKLNQNGVGTIPFVVTVVLAVAFLIFGAWAFSGREKYKNNTQSLINSAVSSAKQQQQSTDNQAFAIAEQKPLIAYSGPQAYGSIALYYPRNWSSFVNTSNNGQPVDGFFYPGTIPSVEDNGSTNFALRLQVESQSYTQVLQTVNSEQQGGEATVSPYALPKVPNVVGVEVTGLLPNTNIKGTMVILPLRSQAIEVWTEGPQYLSNFNNDILANLSFSP